MKLVKLNMVHSMEGKLNDHVMHIIQLTIVSLAASLLLIIRQRACLIHGT